MASDAPMATDKAIRLVAGFEAAKGLLVLLAASGLLALLHQDVHAMAAVLLEHLHLNPASKYPRIFLDAASHVGDARLMWLAAGAALYATVRLVEAYGLYAGRAWAEWLAAGSGALYVPFELLGLVRQPSVHGAALLVLNLAVVALMVHALRQRQGSAGRAADEPAMANAAVPRGTP